MDRSKNSTEPLTRRELTLLIVVCLVVLVTRLPWISADYGTDPDSYRVVTAARHIATTGEYVESRKPGFPVHEYLVASVVNAGPLASNGLTAIFSCLAVTFFALCLRYLGVRMYLLVSLAFALTPVVYINSTSTIDYIPAVAFILASTYFVLIHRPLVAGICLGLAIGCRITSGAMLLPLALWMFLKQRHSTSGKRCLIFCATTLMVGGLCFLPVVHRHGLDFFTFYDNIGYPSLKSLFYKAIVTVWGSLSVVAFLAMFCLAPLFFGHVKASLNQSHIRLAIIISGIVIVLYAISFLRLPHDSGYLIPVVPFFLLSISLLTPAKYLRGVLILVIMSSFITVSRFGIGLSGLIRSDHRYRVARTQETEEIISAVDHFTQDAVIVAGSMLPRIRVVLGGKHQKNHKYVYLIEDLGTYRHYVEQGRHVYFLRDVDGSNMQMYRVDLRKLGAQQLDTLGE